MKNLNGISQWDGLWNYLTIFFLSTDVKSSAPSFTEIKNIFYVTHQSVLCTFVNKHHCSFHWGTEPSWIESLWSNLWFKVVGKFHFKFLLLTSFSSELIPSYQCFCSLYSHINTSNWNYNFKYTYLQTLNSECYLALWYQVP